MSSTLDAISKNVTIYVGIPMFAVGMVGGVLTTIVLLSLRTFRQSPCGLYLLLMALLNITQMLSMLFNRILISGFNIDWSATSRWFCKLRWFWIQFASNMIHICLLLAMIDQFLVTSSRVQWRHWSNLRIARLLSAIFILIWILHGIPYLIYYDSVQSVATGRYSCIDTSVVFQQYHTYGNILALMIVMSLIVTSLFGLLAYHNVQQLSYRTVPLVRRALDKQLTSMVLVQGVYNIITLIPYTILNVLMVVTANNTDPTLNAYLQSLYVIAVHIYLSFFASQFYIYMSVSKRFRQQFLYVLSHFHLTQHRNNAPNQIVPQP